MKDRLIHYFKTVRVQLAGSQAVPWLAMLGLLVGFASGLVIILFRLAIEWMQAGFLPAGEYENYEALSWQWRLLLPLAGAVLIGVIFQHLKPEDRSVSIVHIMERLAYHQGRLPIRNAVVQFVGAALSIASGHSVGREGPTVHLGATTGSQIGQRLRLPDNTTRILLACGVAASIAAAFNTPLAGVIFAMEVVIMEYTIAGFAPVILAAVSATVISRAVFGDDLAFHVPGLSLKGIMELPAILLMGLVVGGLAAAYNHLLIFFTGLLNHWAIALRMMLAGLIVGLCALPVPEIMSIGYDTVEQALNGQLLLGALIAIVVVKLFATTAGLGLGLPGGLIGPTLVIGAAAGGVIGILAHMLFPGSVSSHGFYSLIGMAAMMAAVFQAPLAALIAILELTANPNTILPGMLAVIVASITCKQIIGKDSIYLLLMRAKGLDYRNDPVTQALRRVGVISAMDNRFITLAPVIGHDAAQLALKDQPNWVLLQNEDKTYINIMPAADLARALPEHETDDDIDLLAIPANRLHITHIHELATLQEALERLDATGSEAVIIESRNIPGMVRIQGILTRDRIERSYRL